MIEAKMPLVTLQAKKYEVHFDSWELDWIANYSEKKLRRVGKVMYPLIKKTFGLLYGKNGKREYSLNDVVLNLDNTGKAIDVHLQQHGSFVSPLIKEYLNAKESRKEIRRSRYNEMLVVFSGLTIAHANTSKGLTLIIQYLLDYKGSVSSCREYESLVSLLKELKNDWDLHSYLESNLLFPKILAAGL